MIRFFLVALAFIALVFGQGARPVFAADEPAKKALPKEAAGKNVDAAEPSTDEALAKIVALGPGVQAIKKDKKGRIISCLVVGQSRISTALGKAKGLEVARDRADLAATGEFVKWLKQAVSVHQKSEDETVLFLEGSEEGDKDALKESGKAIEKNSKEIEAVSTGLVRGLQLIHKGIDGEGKTYTVVKGWKADMSEATKKVAADSNSDTASIGNGEKGKKVERAKKPIDKEIEGGSVTSDDAKDFLR